MGRAEAHVEEYLERLCNNKGIPCYKLTSPATNGLPDRLVIVNGHNAYVEAKSDNGHISAIQAVRIREMRASGACVSVIATREEVDALIEHLESLPPLHDNAFITGKADTVEKTLTANAVSTPTQRRRLVS